MTIIDRVYMQDVASRSLSLYTHTVKHSSDGVTPIGHHNYDKYIIRKIPHHIDNMHVYIPLISG